MRIRIARLLLPTLLLPTLLLLTVSTAAVAGPSGTSESAAAVSPEFVTVTLHDIADDPAQLDDSGISSDRLVSFFEWLAGNGWQAISLDDIERARSGGKPLPEKAILITVDDGYSSLYNRIYPLALSYRTPIVAALTGSWLDTPEGTPVQYGNRTLPRSHFISWEQAREMQDSGLVEFASHSYDLHHEVQGNPQGNRLPAAVTRQYIPGTGYESEAAYQARLYRDLQRSREQLQRQLGKAPRAIAWPFGRYNQTALHQAAELGYRHSLTLDPEPSRLSAMDPDALYAINRYLPTDNPSLGEWVTAMQYRDPRPNAQRLVTINPRDFDSQSPELTNQKLGAAIDSLVALGATGVVIDATVPDPSGGLAAAWFPTPQLPLQRDLLSRLAAQLKARAGVQVLLRLPHRAALRTLGSEQQVVELFRDLSRQIPADGLIVEDAPALNVQAPVDDLPPWQVRAMRDNWDTAHWPKADALALQAFQVAETERPGLQLIWLAPPQHSLLQPSSLADTTLVPASLHAPLPLPAGVDHFPADGGDTSRRTGVWWGESSPPDSKSLTAAVRTFQQRGGTIFGWSPQDLIEDRPPAKEIAPAVSARTFPSPEALAQ
ncbi:poly-beta-1,6-N-acetyl-D-glucosamine N-deacetylase PgaB [Microbulbifer aestuariivivens]|uniref:poly-beta-1,6-N-acetyl-D-glucosamine N-deacetylase PgaB n=1 Tax=Microbulbifer aestuariivivens TaxID=1908308 RepID=UPI0031EF3149